jgi:1,4-alpha-glucan branching enzyme
MVQISAVIFCGCAPRYDGPEFFDGSVRFSIRVPEARKVTIAGSFNMWDSEKDALSGPDEHGTWMIILPLAKGRHEYLYLIDSEKWMTDPEAPSVDDGTGGNNSVLVLR